MARNNRAMAGRMLWATACVLLLAAAPVLAETAPDQITITTSDKIIKLIKANRDAYIKDNQKLFAMVDENILPHFDFRKIAQQVLGPTWRGANEEQRSKFTREFRELLVRTYATALLKYNNEEIVYLPVKIAEGDRTVVVRSQVKRGGGAQPISINYSFYRTDAGWKIYDIAIEGPSIVTTYQRVYAERVQKEGLDRLIASLSDENQRAMAGGAGTAK